MKDKKINNNKLDIVWRLGAVEGALLEQVGDGVVGHVDGRIRQALNQPLVVPREPAAQPVRPM